MLKKDVLKGMRNLETPQTLAFQSNIKLKSE